MRVHGSGPAEGSFLDQELSHQSPHQDCGGEWHRLLHPVQNPHFHTQSGARETTRTSARHHKTTTETRGTPEHTTGRKAPLSLKGSSLGIALATHKVGIWFLHLLVFELTVPLSTEANRRRQHLFNIQAKSHLISGYRSRGRPMASIPKA